VTRSLMCGTIPMQPDIPELRRLLAEAESHAARETYLSLTAYEDAIQAILNALPGLLDRIEELEKLRREVDGVRIVALTKRVGELEAVADKIREIFGWVPEIRRLLDSLDGEEKRTVGRRGCPPNPERGEV